MALVPILLGPVAANAGSITYDVNRIVGAGSAVGTIRTDGTLGGLNAGNITDWNLKLFDGSNTFTLTGPASGNDSSVFVTGDVTASTTQLLFNFSGTDAGYLLFEVSFGAGQQYYCDAATNQNFVCLPGESVVPVSVFAPGFINVPRAGNQVIGTVTGTGTGVPEPSTYGLVLTGLLGLGGRLKRKFFS